MAVKVEFKNLPSERPAPVDVPINPVNSYMTALTNYCIASGRKLTVKRTPEGEAHVPQWTSICSIDGEEYGTGSACTRRSADKEAAYQTMRMLEDKGVPLPSTRNYYPIFMDYIREKNLAGRIMFEPFWRGPAHKPTWRCIVSLDGVEIAGGSGPTKKAAMEDASINAASFWP
ncbi:uncharacterized protein FOMMEDRAFT_169889 [Fomitiporia mediterranea MF3/22]|uniref:uncharacterized protein n=1 Tax=Fomitiporia mediterranea (strain MF3/22) TaxID=694068 RepID=UPI0004409084|nr:uncharacterized protein FOMMEDRAFT_169889 [Fomitiporia mediterranea MF3/22]EJD00423.1 hypothetical protein FOMMEDRAFT_169889 [Fomitiporia mediterranea MF3/22]